MRKVKIKISDEIKERCPRLHVGILQASVVNTATNKTLWIEIDKEIQALRNSFSVNNVNQREAIAATREAYKKCGKDPNRYRPSAEALCRRILREMDLYRINTLVDLINFISIRSGYSIGGFDSEKIKGNLTLGIGATNELFEGIGRGALNIEGLPVYRDNLGGVGTPTSDEERTKLTPDTTQLLLIVNAYGANEKLPTVMNETASLIEQFANGTNISIEYV